MKTNNPYWVTWTTVDEAFGEGNEHETLFLGTDSESVRQDAFATLVKNNPHAVAVRIVSVQQDWRVA